MTVVIETTPESDVLLQQEAARRGLTVEVLAKELFQEMLEDLEDAADANRAISETNSDDWVSLDEVRRAVRG